MEEGFTTAFPILTFLNLHKSIFYPWNRESRCKIAIEKVNHAPLCSLKSKQFHINFQSWEKTKSTNFVRKHNMIKRIRSRSISNLGQNDYVYIYMNIIEIKGSR